MDMISSFYIGLIPTTYEMVTSVSQSDSPGMLDFVMIGLVIFLLDASVLRCWQGILKGLGRHPRKDLFWFMPLWIVPYELAPNWNFFAPNPACHDTRILVRWKLPNSITGWKESLLFQPRGGNLLKAFWNPGRYLKKLSIDFSSSLLHEFDELRFHAPKNNSLTVNDNRVQLTTGYMGLLWIASQESAPISASAVQFAVVFTSDSLKQPKVLFCSNWHTTRTDVAVPIE